MPRFARQKVLFQLLYFISLFTFIRLHYIFGLGWEEDLTIDHIIDSLNLVVLAFIEGKPQVVRIPNP